MPDNNKLKESKVNCEYKCVVTQENRNVNFSKRKSCYESPETYVKKQIKIAICLTSTNFLCGYSLAWPAPMVAQLKDPLKTPMDHILTANEIAWLVSNIILGALIGVNIGGYLFNTIGRRLTLFIISSVALTGFSLEASAKDIGTLQASKIIIGLGLGCSNTLNVVYLGEITSPDIRGSVCVMTGILHSLGSLAVYCVGPYVPFAWVSYLAVAVNLVHIACLFYVPESPMFLLMKGKLEEAKLTLHKLGRDKNIDEEIRIIKEGINEKRLLSQETDEHQVTPAPLRNCRELIMEKRNRKAFLITTILLFLQTCGGAIAVIVFATSIFQSARSSVDPDVGTIILGMTEVCGILLSPLLIDRCGRRFLLMLSSGSFCLCMCILGTYFYCEAFHFTLIESVRWLPLLLLITSLFAFNSGLSIVPNTISGEMFSPRVRGTGSSISMTLSYILTLCSLSSFSYITSSLGNHGVFWMYSVFNGFGFIFVLLRVPETKGKTLLEVGHMLER